MDGETRSQSPPNFVLRINRISFAYMGLDLTFGENIHCAYFNPLVNTNGHANLTGR